MLANLTDYVSKEGDTGMAKFTLAKIIRHI